MPISLPLSRRTFLAGGVSLRYPFAQQGTKAGQMQPDILLPSLEGNQTFALSQWRGKKVLLAQFASW